MDIMIFCDVCLRRNMSKKCRKYKEHVENVIDYFKMPVTTGWVSYVSLCDPLLLPCVLLGIRNETGVKQGTAHACLMHR